VEVDRERIRGDLQRQVTQAEATIALLQDQPMQAIECILLLEAGEAG
jgi:hypothetical protein